MSFLRHPAKVQHGTTSIVVVVPPERRLWVYKVRAIGATGPITFTEETDGLYWTEQAAGDTFYVPLRQPGAGQDVTIAAPAATALSLLYGFEGA